MRFRDLSIKVIMYSAVFIWLAVIISDYLRWAKHAI